MRRGLGAGRAGIDGSLLAGHHVAMKRILHPRRGVGLPPQPLQVRLVLREEQLRRALARQDVVAHLRVGGHDRAVRLAEAPALAPASPRTMCCGTTTSAARGAVPALDPWLWTVMRTRMSSGPAFAYSTNDVEVAVLVERAGVDQLVLEVLARSPAVGLDQIAVGKLALRVLVEELHVRVRRRRVDVEVVLLDVLAVIALAVGETEETFLQDRVALVPQRQREAQALLVVGDAAQPVFAPTIGARSRLVVTEVVPGVAVGAVVLAHRAPLPLAQVRAPALPARCPVRVRRSGASVPCTR